MKKFLILLIVVAVVVLAWWMLSSDQATAPTTDQTAQSDSASIEAELSGLTDADLDAEFKAVDEDAAKL
jgi:hypothetical protein